MRKNGKKLLSLVLALVMVLGMLPSAALAAGVTVTEVVPCKYDEIRPFSDGLAKVSIKVGNYSYKSGFIDKTGKEVVPCQYDSCGDFSEGLALVGIKVGDYSYEYGFIDKTGRKVIPCQYGACGDFSGGLAPAAIITGGDEYHGYILKWGFIDRAGNEVIPFKYDMAEKFSEGLAWVYMGVSEDGYVGKWGLIDATGKEIVPCIFDGYIGNADLPHSFPFSEGLAPVTVEVGRDEYNESNYKYGYTDKAGNLVIPAKYDRAFSFSDGLAVVVTGGYFGKVGAIDKTGREVIPCKYDWVDDFSEGLASVELNGKWGFIDKTGREVIPYIYEYAGSFSEGLASVKRNGQWRYIDKTGKEVVTLKYNYYVGDISEGFAVVNMNGKRGLISVSGVGTNLRTVNLPFYSGLGNKTNFISVDWDWSLFGGPSFTSKDYETYDNRLAVTALALSAAAEHSQEETKNILTSVLGFNDYEHKNYDSSADLNPAVNFACKETVVNGQTQYIFAIVVRGSSNLDDAWTDISSIWGGFDTAASHLHAQLGTFMGNTSLPDSDVPIGGGGRVKFFVTGHSLGGAVANIMAKNLSDVYGAENVFAYTFASPKVIPADKEFGNGNIYNIINREDWVPASPPNLKGRNGLPIGFSRHDFAGVEQKFAELTNGKSLNSLMKPSMLFWESHNQLWYPHAVETYMSFLLALSNDASIADRFAGGASHGLMGGGGWCPVDLDIYVDTDKGPKLVGRIKDNVIDDSVTTGVVLRVDGDKKYFYFPLEGNYTIKLTGTGTDTMTYFVQEMDLETGEPIPGTGVEFQSVSLMPGKQFSSDVQISQETITEIGTNLYVLDSTGTPEKEVLPDGKGTEIPYEPKPAAVKFTDVPSDAWYYDAVQWAVENGITTGTSATTFSPDVSCTRAQIVTLLWRAAGSPGASGSNSFADVPQGSYYYDAVLWAVSQGITTGTSTTTFSPDVVCTRAQAVTFLHRAAGFPATAGTSPFTDVVSGSYYTDAVQWAVSKGVVNGTTPTTFSPEQTCTRAQIVTLLYRDRAGKT